MTDDESASSPPPVPAVVFIDLSDDPPLQEALARVRAAGACLVIDLDTSTPGGQ